MLFSAADEKILTNECVLTFQLYLGAVTRAFLQITSEKNWQKNKCDQA